MKEGWIREGWLCQEGELLLHLRERQDKRLFHGGDNRVHQDWKESGQKRCVLMIPDEDDVDIKNQEDFFKMSSTKSS